MIDPADTLTTDEVAAALDVTPAAVRQLVARGQLQPVHRGVRPLMFDEAQVWQLKHSRRRPGELQRIRRLARDWAES